jgi:hypothetical protein
MLMKNKITPADVENAIVKEEYVKLGTKMTACLLTLRNGHEVVGIAGVVDASTYDIEIGSPIAREKAVDQVWGLMGYELQQRIHMNELGKTELK